MSIQYHIYKGSNSGGPVDFTTVVATVTGTSYSPTAIPINSDVTFAVRAFDTVSGLEEQGVTALFRIVTDGSGADVTNRPRPPQALRAVPTATGSLKVQWWFPPIGPKPTQFKVYVGVGTVNYATAVATKAYQNRSPTYSVTVSGLTAGSLYLVGVRAGNASGEETNLTTTTGTPAASLTDTPVVYGSPTVGTAVSGLDPDGYLALP